MPAKLTHEQAVAIRRDPRQQAVVAADYGVVASTISNIRRGRTWGSADEEEPPIRYGQARSLATRQSRALTADQIREIRESKEPSAALAGQFGVSKTLIGRIKRWEIYKQ